MVEEEHVTQYESLMDSRATWLEMLLWHEYTECYLYWSCYLTETDAYIKGIWEEYLEMEIAHLHKAVELLQKYEGKTWQEVIPDGEFPTPIALHENIEYVRDILATTVQYTGDCEEYTKVENLPASANFFQYQKIVNPRTEIVPSQIIAQVGAIEGVYSADTGNLTNTVANINQYFDITFELTISQKGE